MKRAKIGLLIFSLVLTLSLSSNRMVLGAWISFDAVTSTSVSQASIASDGTNLLVFYRYPNFSLNIDEGIIKKWNSSSWVALHYVTSQCHDPDIAVQGSLIAAS